MAGEASDVKVVVVDTDHFSFAGVSTAVALDDIGAASGIVRILLIRNCRKKQRDHFLEGLSPLQTLLQDIIIILTGRKSRTRAGN